MAKSETHIVKRRGHREKFDERKVYGSCYAACMVVGMSEKQTEGVCESVTKDVKRWIKNKGSVDAHQIFNRIASSLRKHNKDAAFMYETHKDIA